MICCERLGHFPESVSDNFWRAPLSTHTQKTSAVAVAVKYCDEYALVIYIYMYIVEEMAHILYEQEQVHGIRQDWWQC